MRNKQNIESVIQLEPDFMGFIFHKLSPRYAPIELSPSDITNSFPKQITKVGVFVDSPKPDILDTFEQYELNVVQLYHTSPQDIDDYEKRGIKTICAFSISDSTSAEALKENLKIFEHASYFLFDTKVQNLHGGTGKKFDRSIIFEAGIEKPFFIAGGVDLAEVPSLKKHADHSNMIGIDVNSLFETAPAYKDIEKLKQLKYTLSHGSDS